MTWAEIIYPAAALVSATAAVLAWAAKLRWSQEFKDATEQVIKAKDAEIGSLKTEITVLQSVNSSKLLEHAASTRQGLEGIILKNEEELNGARTTIEGLQKEIRELRAIPSRSGPGQARLSPPVTDPQIAERSEALEIRLNEALREERHLREKQLMFRLLKLESAPDLERQFAEDVDQLRTERSRIQQEFDERKAEWMKDQQDAFTKLYSYRDRAAELMEQLRTIRRLGAEGTCPTCGKSIGEGSDRLIRELEEQWAELTQDGKWWKARVDQLDEVPLEISELEQHLTVLSARIEDRTEKLVRCQEAVRELADVRHELHALRIEVSK